MTRIALAGAAGRMGKCIVRLIREGAAFELVAALERADSPAVGADCGEVAGIGRCNLPIQPRTAADFDVLLDFSTPAGTMQWLDFCASRDRPIVVCPTGHDDAQLARIRAVAARIAVLQSPNTSLGVNLMLRLVAEVAARLGDDSDIEIVEVHHRFKRDAPSGTAMALLRAIAEATGRDAATDAVFGRYGRTGERPRRQIGVHAVRAGDTVGEHEVRFGVLGETLSIRHVAQTRDTFARGALRAAAWLVGKPPGLYSMQDVLFT